MRAADVQIQADMQYQTLTCKEVMIQAVSTGMYNNINYVCYFMSQFQTASFALLSAFFDG